MLEEALPEDTNYDQSHTCVHTHTHTYESSFCRRENVSYRASTNKTTKVAIL